MTARADAALPPALLDRDLLVADDMPNSGGREDLFSNVADPETNLRPDLLSSRLRFQAGLNRPAPHPITGAACWSLRIGPYRKRRADDHHPYAPDVCCGIRPDC